MSEEKLREALDRIARPIYWMQKEAEENGSKINGRMALEISNDPEYLKSIARTALENS